MTKCKKRGVRRNKRLDKIDKEKLMNGLITNL